MKPGFNKATRGNKIIIEKQFGELEISQIKKHAQCPEIAFYRTKHKDLDFLKSLVKLGSVQFYSAQIDDYKGLEEIQTLENLFLHGIKNHEDLSFISHLTQLQSLDLLYLPQLKKFPDLSNCKALKRIRIWTCKKLSDIQNLSLIPKLEEINIVDTPQKPMDLEFLLKLKQLKYLSAQFASNKANQEFEGLLAKHGKLKFRPHNLSLAKSLGGREPLQR